jgi:hypothetical protein
MVFIKVIQPQKLEKEKFHKRSNQLPFNNYYQIVFANNHQKYYFCFNAKLIVLVLVLLLIKKFNVSRHNYIH